MDGTGIAVSGNAVITCEHVVTRDSAIWCNGRVREASRVTANHRWDLACLHFDKPLDLAPTPLFHTRRLRGFPLKAIGPVQIPSGFREHSVPDLEVIQEEQHDGRLQTVQLKGGIREGFSGAPVLARVGDDWHAVGMLFLGGQETAASRMSAVDPIVKFLDEARVRYSLDDLPPRDVDCFRVPAKPWSKDRALAALLKAEHEVVPFGGRAAELSDLTDWAFRPEPIRVRLYHERGGVGKTRLALEVCRRLKTQKVHAGFLDRTAELDQARDLLAATEDAGLSRLFVVIDYAEISPGRLDSLMVASRDHPTVQLRIMLLARGLGNWWERARYSGNGLGEILSAPGADQPILLGPVVLSADLRRSEFERAAAAFASILEQDIPEDGAIDLNAPVFDRALVLHMSALLRVLDVPFSVRSDNAAPFLEALLLRETRFLDGAIRSRGLDPLLVDGAVQAVAAFTAIGGTGDLADAVSVIRVLPVFRGLSNLAIHAFADLLHNTYGGARWIDPLQPDILGEYAILKAFGDDYGGLNEVLNR